MSALAHAQAFRIIVPLYETCNKGNEENNKLDISSYAAFPFRGESHRASMHGAVYLSECN